MLRDFIAFFKALFPHCRGDATRERGASVFAFDEGMYSEASLKGLISTKVFQAQPPQKGAIMVG